MKADIKKKISWKTEEWGNERGVLSAGHWFNF
jgi:hypothetical protein